MNLTVKWERRQTSDPRRRTLERAVIEEIAGRGFSEASIAGAYRRAEVPERVFDEHFADLEDAYCEVFHSLVGEIFERSVPFFLSERGWRDQIRALAYEIFRYLDEDPARARFIVVEVRAAAWVLSDYLDEDHPRARFLMVEAARFGERAHLIRFDALQIAIDVIDQGREELDDPASVAREIAEWTAVKLFASVVEAIKARDDGIDEGEVLVRRLLRDLVEPYVGPEEAGRELSAPRP